MLNSEKVRFGSSEYKKLSVDERFAILEEVVEAIIASKSKVEPQPKQSEDDIAALMDRVETKDAIIICYRKMGSQTKEQVKTVLKKWGTPYGSWFNGGNFAVRLVGKGILTPDRKDDSGRTIFTLTVRGRKIADELIQELRAG